MLLGVRNDGAGRPPREMRRCDQRVDAGKTTPSVSIRSRFAGTTGLSHNGGSVNRRSVGRKGLYRPIVLYRSFYRPGSSQTITGIRARTPRPMIPYTPVSRRAVPRASFRANSQRKPFDRSELAKLIHRFTGARSHGRTMTAGSLLPRVGSFASQPVFCTG
jgi:hypothetical protein